MADLGIPELLIILVIVLVLFGPSRLKGVARSLGEGIREFRHSVRDESLPAASTETPVLTQDDPTKPADESLTEAHSEALAPIPSDPAEDVPVPEETRTYRSITE